MAEFLKTVCAFILALSLVIGSGFLIAVLSFTAGFWTHRTMARADCVTGTWDADWGVCVVYVSEPRTGE